MAEPVLGPSLCHYPGTPHQLKALRRVVYDVISYDAVQWLKEHPPMVEHVYYVAEQYRFVQPIYGLELDISGLREIQGANPVYDEHGWHSDEPSLPHFSCP